jgi:hypothetical protein
VHADSATSAFLQGLDRRVEATGPDLESMAFVTVSVEELLGHCSEALNIVSRHAGAGEFRLVSFGYVAPGTSTHTHIVFCLVQTWSLSFRICTIPSVRSISLIYLSVDLNCSAPRTSLCHFTLLLQEHRRTQIFVQAN